MILDLHQGYKVNGMTLIDEKRILLENRWEKIKDENHWGKLEKDSEKPNWICKDCFDGGILLQIQN